jgi:hypothetical protein
MKKLATLVGIVSLMVSSQAMAAFQTTEGTMALGGAAAFTVGDSMSLNVAPEVGYFIMDNVEVMAAFSLDMNLDAETTNIGFGAGGMYYMDMDMFILKTGVVVSGWIPDGGDMMLSLGVPVHALFPMNDHVAIVTGATVNLVDLTDASGAGMQIAAPIGYLGVQAHF